MFLVNLYPISGKICNRLIHANQVMMTGVGSKPVSYLQSLQYKCKLFKDCILLLQQSKY